MHGLTLPTERDTGTKMKRFIAAALMSLFLLIPISGYASSPYSPESLIRWAGCTAQIVTSDQRSVMSSMYNPYSHTVYIGTAEQYGVTRDFRVAIIFHEVQHCLQGQAGHLDGPGYFQSIVDVELDADRGSADLMCQYHMDGVKILHDLFVWARAEFGYEGDPNHGTLEQRISQGENAMACQLVPPQS